MTWQSFSGRLPNGTEVAVKQIKQEKAAEQELLSEMKIIGRIHHRHLVKILGYCLTEPYQLLVYEYVPNKTLSYHLHGQFNQNSSDNNILTPFLHL
jgi:Protein tyrosine and serine/threonine kinase